ncbi:hypothetical protein VOH97_002624 [Clostridium perfringens]|uniref:hypothetical protein n=1 Tax=Clostridium perfringens TaxID=1502 RepID=UPI0024BC4ABE|nr:hypothetical protein [Clostridium perfringens]
MFNNIVENTLNNMNKREIINKVSDMLNIKKLLIDERDIGENIKIKAFAQHNKGLIDINRYFIASTLNNYLLKLENDNMQDKFLKLFIESMLVHELHHVYLYKFQKELYEKFKHEDEDVLYSCKRIEIQADEFMISYMEKYYQNKGKYVAQFLKVLRDTPGGERKFNELDRLIEQYMNTN